MRGVGLAVVTLISVFIPFLPLQVVSLINMGEPCLNSSYPCYDTVDITRPVSLISYGAVNTKRCSVSLMPWSPFPCQFDPSLLNATPGQPTDLCTNELVNFQYLGVLPNLDKKCFPTGNKNGRQLLGAKLNLNFKVAQGIQFDRVYNMYINNSAVAFGTTTEPSYWPPSSGGGDKKWATERDISHLQSVFLPGASILFTLVNYLTNTYNVPIWASAKLELLYGKAPKIPPESQSPDQVLPIWTYGSVSGTGGGPPWPSASFQLPSLAPSNIHRAQIEIIPKSNGCEEFWAENTSGNQTDNTCNGVSTGEPYRELRFYVNGQVTGFSPIYATIYTGGIAPRLWSTIVAYKAYMLPSYTFDLGPWLGAINGLDGNVTITLEVVGDANGNWNFAGVLLLWRGSKSVVASVGAKVTAPAYFNSRDIPSSNCQGEDLTDPYNGTGVCALTLKGYQMLGSGAVTLSDGSRIESTVHYGLHHYSNVISFNNTAETQSYVQSSSHSSFWSTQSISKQNKVKSSLTHDFTYDWMNSGQILTGGIWVNSFNFSGTDGDRRLSQAHFQRLEMVEGDYSNYTMPPYIVPEPTHTVYLHSVDSFDTPTPTVLQLATATWAANKLNSSETVKCSALDSWRCWPRNPLNMSSEAPRRPPLSQIVCPVNDFRSPWTLRDNSKKLMQQPC